MFAINCQAILFDLDGTLIESTSFIERLWQDWGMQHGITPERMAEVMHGRRAGEIVSIVAPHLPLKEAVYAMETTEILHMDGMKAYTGAREILQSLSPKQWAVVTSGSVRVATARLNYAKLPMPEILVTGDDVKAGKPAPDAFLLAANRLHKKPADCVVVEDAPAGIRAGKAAGMKVIGVASSHPKKDLHQADVVVGHLADLQLHITSTGISIQIK